MITPEMLRERLAERPFRPFCVYLSDQAKFEIPHPEFAWVLGRSLLVGIPGNLPFALGDTFRQLSILHITRIEPLAPLPPLARKKTKK